MYSNKLILILDYLQSLDKSLLDVLELVEVFDLGFAVYEF
jgi:hypothetical protein